MIRLLVRLLLSNPVVLFSAVAVVVVVASVVAFVLSERRARAMAALAEDGEIAVSQRRRLATIIPITLLVLAAAAWWVFVRVHTEPDRVLVAIRVEEQPGEADTQWWHGNPGARTLALALSEELADAGLEVVEPGDGTDRGLAWAQGDHDSLVAAGRREQARWVLDGYVTPKKRIALPGAEQVDYIMTVELELLDAETGERHPVLEEPLRAFLWGTSADEAVQLNGTYLAGRLTKPIIAAVAAREAMQGYREKRPEQTIDENLRVERLAPLFARQSDQAEALALRESHVAQAEKSEPEERSKVPRARIGAALAEEFVIGTASDGRLVIHADPKHVSAAADGGGYVITNEGENFLLADLDGASREVLFEHYNIYGVPAVSADGRWIWVVLANHGHSKTLGAIEIDTGALTTVLNHPSDYYAVPTPSPDGARATFLRRSSRRGQSALEVIGRDGAGRVSLAGPDRMPGASAWARDGSRVYAVLHAPTATIVAIDPETGVQEHLLGETAEAREARLAFEADLRAAREALELIELGGDPPEGTDVDALREFVEENAPAIEGEGGEAEAAPPPDPVSTSAFVDVAMSADGESLFVIEVAAQADGSSTRVVGRYDLGLGSYTRLMAADALRILPSPVHNRVAVVVRNHPASPRDTERRDDEILVLGPGSEDRQLITDNGVDDEVTAWSRDGAALLSFQRGEDPGSTRTPVARIYRHDL